MQVEKGALERIVASLDQNTPARAVPLNEEEHALVKGLQLLTMKPMIYAANVSEGNLADSGASNVHVKALREKASQDNCEVIIVSAQVRYGLTPWSMQDSDQVIISDQTESSAHVEVFTSPYQLHKGRSQAPKHCKLTRPGRREE